MHNARPGPYWTLLAAVRQGPAGSETINAGITGRLARPFNFNPLQPWYHGRPATIRQNDYKTGLFNGDIGIALNNSERQIRVWFVGDTDLRAFLPRALPAHDSVYAMTIHKSQGSEFDLVTRVLPERDSSVLTKELFYTGLTRTCDRLSVYGDSAILRRKVRQQVHRISCAADRLSD